jgi:hypothetical protein
VNNELSLFIDMYSVVKIKVTTYKLVIFAVLPDLFMGCSISKEFKTSGILK